MESPQKCQNLFSAKNNVSSVYSVNNYYLTFFNNPLCFLAIHIIVACSLICLYTLEAYIANNMDPDQTASVGAV